MPRENAAGLEKALVGVWLAREGLLDLLGEHKEDGEPDCGCLFCEELRGLNFMAKQIELYLEGDAAKLSAPLTKLRGRGFPPAPVLAELVLNHGDDAEDTDDGE